MRIEAASLKRKSSLMKDYQNHDQNIMDFFEYKPLDDFESRLQYLSKKSFKRKELADTLHILNEQWGASRQTLENIERLKDDRAVTIVGGQQAGLLSGPLYTINKILSIIKLAREEEKKLKLPVIPVFWIAGEDHDFAEINHIHLVNPPEIKKHQLNQHVRERTAVSHIGLDQEALKDWLDQAFLHLHETIHTKKLYKQIQKCMKESSSYVDFFARFINVLFKEEGLVLVDSNHELIRKLERDYFIKLIHKQESISKEIFTSTQLVRQAGYDLTIDPGLDDAHLFYHLNHERILLSREKDNLWLGKQEDTKFTRDELIEIARKSPEKLSNNVMTRPLMQEMLFPTLAFVGGWGEISYWSVLRRAFSVLDLKMPPLVPRLSFSYIEPKIQKIVEKYSLNYEDALSKGVLRERINWLNSQPVYPTEILAEQLKKDISELHKPLRSIAEKISPDIRELSKSNLYLIQDKIDYLIHCLQKEVERQHEKTLVDFSSVHLSLYPNKGLQERVFNPIYFLNEYGRSFIDHILQEQLSFKEDHYLVFL